MSFLGDYKKHNQKCNDKKLYKRTSLIHPNPIPNKGHLKRMSSFLLFSKKGSVTIEASVAIPLFLFAILNIFSLILIMGKYSAETARMQQEAKLLSVHAHVIGETQTEWICLEKPVEIKPLIPIAAFPTSITYTGAHARKWIGYDLNSCKDEFNPDEWVYITPNGQVYHRNRSCTYINQVLHCGSLDNISQKRNANREKYRCCEICGKSASSGICFYTKYGNCYHLSLQCSSLKKNVKTVRLSEVRNRRACSKCGEG